MNNDKKVYVISNSNTNTLDQELIKRQEEIARRSNNTKSLMTILLVFIVAICIILFFYLLDGLGSKAVNDRTTTFPVTLNSTSVTNSTDRIVYTPTTRVQQEATHTYSR